MTAQRSGAVERARVWVPGVLVVSSEGELVMGAHAGFNGYGDDFALSKCGHAGSLQNWRHRAWMVERRDLDEDALQRHAIILPETLLDPERQPHALKWLATQPLVCVSGSKVAQLLDAGLRIYTVAYGVEEDHLLAVSAEGGDRAPRSLRVPFHELVPNALRSAGETSGNLHERMELDARTFVDRVLNEMSGGALREISVVNALAARQLIEPGYGYRGATHGEAAAIEDVTAELAALDALFAQVFRRARAQRSAAEQIVRAASDVAEAAMILGEIPIYSSARKVTLDEIQITMTPGAYVRSSASLDTLVLPAETRWFVDRVTMWRPSLRRGRAGVPIRQGVRI